MANIKSQKKRNRQTVKRYAHNKSLRSELKTREKAVLDAGTLAVKSRYAIMRAVTDFKVQGREILLG